MRARYTLVMVSVAAGSVAACSYLGIKAPELPSMPKVPEVSSPLGGAATSATSSPSSKSGAGVAGWTSGAPQKAAGIAYEGSKSDVGDEEFPTDKKIDPRPGIEKILPKEPSWCDGIDKKKAPALTSDSSEDPFSGYKGANLFFDKTGSVKMMDRNDASDLKEYYERLGGYVNRTLGRSAAWSACLRPKDKNRQQWIAAIRQVMVNTTGLSEAENVEVMSLYVRSTADELASQAKAKCAAMENAEPKSAAEGAEMYAQAIAFGCQVSPKANRYWSVAMRLPELPTELSKGVFVADCFPTGLDFVDKLAEADYLTTGNQAGNYLFCSHEVQSLDKKKLHKQLDATKWTPLERVSALEAYGIGYLKAQLLAQGLKLAEKKYRGFADVFTKAPAKGFAEWVKVSGKHRAEFELAFSYEEKFYQNKESKSALKKAFAGCDDALRDKLGDYVHSRKPKTVAAFREAMTDPVAYRLFAAALACDAIIGNPEAARAQKDLLLDHAVQNDNPRWSALAEGTVKAAELKADREDFPLDPITIGPVFSGAVSEKWAVEALKMFSSVEHQGSGEWSDDRFNEASKKGAAPGNFDGEIQSIGADKGEKVVKFKEATWKEPALECVTTNHVDGIEWSGDHAMIVYHQNCKQVGWNTMHSRQEPMAIPAAQARGLRPGMSVRICTAAPPASGKPRRGIIVEGYANDSRKKLVYGLGVGLE